MVLDKKQKILLISFIIIILITIGLLYFNYAGRIIKTKSAETPKQPNQAMPDGRQADFSIFEDPAFKELDNQSQGPIDIGQIGRENPFAPYYEPSE